LVVGPGQDAPLVVRQQRAIDGPTVLPLVSIDPPGAHRSRQALHGRFESRTRVALVSRPSRKSELRSLVGPAVLESCARKGGKRAGFVSDRNFTLRLCYTPCCIGVGPKIDERSN